MKKKKNKPVKNVRSTNETNQNIPPIVDSDELSTDFLDENAENRNLEGSETENNAEDDEIIIPYDTVWKTIIVEFYADFMQFFLPDLFSKLDVSIEPVFLDQELLAIQKELNIPKQITDKLIKVRLKDGTEQWLLIHVEIQTKFEFQFSTRMYLYQSFIFAKHRLPITALAIFTRAGTPKKFNIYETECFGTSLIYRYNAYKIAKQDEIALTNSDNIFALFVLAHLYVIKTTPKKYVQRLSFKEKLFELAQQKQIPPERITRMLIFVDQILELPIQLQNSFLEQMAAKNPNQALLDLQAKMKLSEEPIENFVFYRRTGRTVDEWLVFWKAEAEADKQKAEADKQKAEADKQKAEADKQKAEADKLHYQIQSVIALHEQAAFSVDKVASILQLPLNEVVFMLSLHKQALAIDAIIPKLKEFQANLLKNK